MPPMRSTYLQGSLPKLILDDGFENLINILDGIQIGRVGRPHHLHNPLSCSLIFWSFAPKHRSSILNEHQLSWFILIIQKWSQTTIVHNFNEVDSSPPSWWHLNKGKLLITCECSPNHNGRALGFKSWCSIVNIVVLINFCLDKNLVHVQIANLECGLVPPDYLLPIVDHP